MSLALSRFSKTERTRVNDRAYSRNRPLPVPRAPAGERPHGLFDQNMSFAPSWKMRGAKAPFNWPKSVLVTPVLRPLNCVWLKVL